MATPYNLTIIACDGIFFNGEVDMLIFPGVDGLSAIMAHHEVMTGVIDIGSIRFRTMDNQWHDAVVSDGMVSVYPDGNVKMLVYSCERPEDIDVYRAQEALERAREQLQQKQSIQEYHISTANMARAMARLKGANGGIRI